MKTKSFAFHAAASQDLARIWRLIYMSDGDARADGVYARIEAFCRSLGEFSDVGTGHDERRPGLRSVGVHGLKTVTVLFLNSREKVIVLRIGYLGENVWAELPE